jgi:hypothetical protein
MFTRYHTRFAALLVAILVAAACEEASGPQGEGAVEVRAFAVGSAEQSGIATSGVTAARIERVKLVLGRIKLEKADESTTDFVDERSVVVTLTPNGSAVLAIDADVSAGSYKELELAFDKLELGKVEEQTLLQSHPTLANASLLIEGTITRNGIEEPFTFITDLDMDVELGFNPALTIPLSGTTTLVSLVLDVSRWLSDSTGRLLDPLAAASRSTIEGNVQSSIELFEDSDRNGR